MCDASDADAMDTTDGVESQQPARRSPQPQADEPRQPPRKKRAKPVHMTISLKDIKNEIDPAKFFERELLPALSPH